MCKFFRLVGLGDGLLFDGRVLGHNHLSGLKETMQGPHFAPQRGKNTASLKPMIGCRNWCAARHKLPDKNTQVVSRAVNESAFERR
jgi:hypothetical protein